MKYYINTIEINHNGNIDDAAFMYYLRSKQWEVLPMNINGDEWLLIPPVSPELNLFNSEILRFISLDAS